MIRFIHCADIHLDSPLRGLSNYPEAPVELLRNASREAFAALIDLAVEEAVNFMVIAGDLYDGDWRDFNTGIYFVQQMKRLNEAGIPVFLLHGNHDAESLMTRSLELPGNVRVFPAKKSHSFLLDDIRVAVHGQSFARPDTRENLAAQYPKPRSGYLNIGVLHTALEGYAAHASYAPCSVAELQARGYQYWALGHVHQYQQVTRDPWIVFPGNLQGRHIRETGAKGAVVVEVEDVEVVNVEQVFTDVLRWQSLEVKLDESRSFTDVLARVHASIEAALSEAGPARALAARITLTGASAVHNELLRQEERLRAEIRALSTGNSSGKGDSRTWIEKIRIRTSPIGYQGSKNGTDESRSDALGELAAMLDGAPDDEELVQQLESVLMPLANRLPAAIRAELDDGPLKQLCDGDMSGLISSAIPELLARLGSDPEEKNFTESRSPSSPPAGRAEEVE